jgi:hypothetical protein
MNITLRTVFSKNVNYSNELFCFWSRCTVQEDEAQLSTSNDVVGSRNEEGKGNTNDENNEEVVENEGVCHIKDTSPPTTAVGGRICKVNAIEMKDRKRKV